MRFLWLGVLLCAATQVMADGTPSGARLFHLHCAACHGATGQGDGPMAKVLVDAPADLTTLARRNGGDLPLEQIVSQIDGRLPLTGHGGSMPVYGYFLDGPDVTLPGSLVRTTQPVADLITWLQEHQIP